MDQSRNAGPVVGPKPWKTHTGSIDFREGGKWIYAMLGPEGEKHWTRADFKDISELR